MDSFEAGKWRKQRDYRSFAPSIIDRPWRIDSPKVLEALSRADRELGRLDMFSEHVPDLDLFVRMHVTREATKSSKIEGTQTEIGEAILPEEEIYDRLTSVREKNAIAEWLHFFLDGITETAKNLRANSKLSPSTCKRSSINTTPAAAQPTTSSKIWPLLTASGRRNSSPNYLCRVSPKAKNATDIRSSSARKWIHDS